MRRYVRSSSIRALSKSPANRSRTILSGSSASSYTSAGASATFALDWMFFQSRWRKIRSRSMSSADAPSAAVRTMIPPPFGSRFFRISLRRTRSASSSRRETPLPSPFGTYTRNRPGSEISVVSLAPFDFIGSLTAWTRMVCPRLIRSWIFRAPLRPSSSGPTISSTYRNPFFSSPISTNAASIPGRTLSTTPK